MTELWADGGRITATLIGDIKAFCRAKDISWNRFGMLAIGDGRLVSALDFGRELREETELRVRDFLNANVDAKFDYLTLRPADAEPRTFYNPRLKPLQGSDDWQRRIERGSEELLRAIARSHPERVAA